MKSNRLFALTKSLIAWVSLLTCGALTAAEFHVAVTGNDANAGTAAAPFRSLGRARDAVRPLLADMKADMVVVVHGGWHIVTEPLEFTTEDSGQSGFNVIYRAAPGEQPVLSGGRRITGWTRADAAKNLWQASVPGLKTRQLYVDCQRAIRARSPGKVLPQETTQDATGYLVRGDVPMRRWRNTTAIEFVHTGTLGGTGILVGKGSEWTEIRLGVAAFSDEAGRTRITMKQPGYGMCYKPSGNWQDKYQSVALPAYVENAFELLDEPGEWYLDEPAGMIFYIPRPGEDLGKAVVVATVAERLLVARGSQGPRRPVQNLRFEGFTFAHTTWLQPNGPKGYPELQAGEMRDGSHVPAAVQVGCGDRVRFERCVFVHLGGGGIEVDGGSTRCEIRGSRFAQVSGNAVRIGTVSDPRRNNADLRDIDNVVSNCHTVGVPCEYHGCPAIQIGYTDGTVATHNVIEHVSYTGISVGWGWGTPSYARRNRVIGNRVNGYKEILADGAGWYALGPQPESEVARNFFQREIEGGSGGAIYPDEGSEGWTIHDNVVDISPDRRWTYIWVNTIRNLTYRDNWMNSAMIRNEGTNIVMVNSTLVRGPWPVPAQRIIDEAGLEPAWRDVGTLKEGCASREP
jgi:hypothetical protein